MMAEKMKRCSQEGREGGRQRHGGGAQGAVQGRRFPTTLHMSRAVALLAVICTLSGPAQRCPLGSGSSRGRRGRTLRNSSVAMGTQG
jgi:hypothetical protein